MKIIKLSTSPWLLTQTEFNCYTPAGDGVIRNYKFEVNNDCNQCDYWVVRGNIQRRLESVKCPPGNIIFLQDEVYDERVYNRDYLSQFAVVIGPKSEIAHENYLWNYEMVPWLFKNKSYKDLCTPQDPGQKTRKLCLMTSDAVWIEGHKTRFAFSNKLIGHFKDRLDVYGRGFNPFDCKYEVLKNYRYCIALENSIYPDYFTEKINECFLAETYPIYYGCPDLTRYYDQDAFGIIDAKNFQTSIATIERILEDDEYLKKLDRIRAMKIRYLEKYHFPIRLVELLETHFESVGKKKKKLLFSESFYYGYSKGLFHLKMGAQIVGTRTISKINSFL